MRLSTTRKLAYALDTQICSENHEINILSGCFLVLPKRVIVLPHLITSLLP